jgi:hypothetical protein
MPLRNTRALPLRHPTSPDFIKTKIATCLRGAIFHIFSRRYAFLLSVLAAICVMMDDIKQTKKRDWWPMLTFQHLVAGVKIVGESAAGVFSLLLFAWSFLCKPAEIGLWATSLGTPASIFALALIQKAEGAKAEAVAVHMLYRAYVVAYFEVLVVISLLFYYDYRLLLSGRWVLAIFMALFLLLWGVASLVGFGICIGRAYLESISDDTKLFNETYEDDGDCGPTADEMVMVTNFMAFGPAMLLKCADFYFTFCSDTLTISYNHMCACSYGCLHSSLAAWLYSALWLQSSGCYAACCAILARHCEASYQKLCATDSTLNASGEVPNRY